jgi:hypothetical protein
MNKIKIKGVAAVAALVAALPGVADAETAQATTETAQATTGTTQATTGATGWRQAPIPVGSGESFLTDVAVFGRRDAWAIGTTTNATDPADRTISR